MDTGSRGTREGGYSTGNDYAHTDSTDRSYIFLPPKAPVAFPPRIAEIGQEAAAPPAEAKIRCSCRGGTPRLVQGWLPTWPSAARELGGLAMLSRLAPVVA